MAPNRSPPQATYCVRVLDAGALIALDRGDRDAWALITEVHRMGQRPCCRLPWWPRRGAEVPAKLALPRSCQERS